jgi:glutathione S-transferase
MTRQSNIRLYKFGAGWASPLPTAGPFALKLETWFRIVGLAYESSIENDARKGPNQKSPWIDDGELRLPDSELIIEHLKRARGLDPDRGLDAAAAGAGVAWRRLFEEHYHQAFEHALFMQGDGAANLAPFLGAVAAPFRSLANYAIRSALRKQLFARGLARHDTATLNAMAMADLDAAEAWLSARSFFLGDQPSTTDATAFAFLALTLYTSLDTPLHLYARTLPNVRSYCDRMVLRFFPEATALTRSGHLRAA